MDGKFTGEIDSNIMFFSAVGKPIFIINKEGCHVPEGVSVEESAKAVIDTLDEYIKSLFKDLTIQRDELVVALEECVHAEIEKCNEKIVQTYDDIGYYPPAVEKYKLRVRYLKELLAKAKGE